MPAPLDEPLYLTSVKLFAADVEFLKQHQGHGWTEIVRNVVREYVKLRKKIDSNRGPDVEIILERSIK